MNLLELYHFLKSLENSIQGKVTIGVPEFSGIQVRAFWMYKDTVIHWQYVISVSKLDMIQDNSMFVRYLIEKARAEYQRKTWEIDTDDRKKDTHSL